MNMDRVQNLAAMTITIVFILFSVACGGGSHSEEEGENLSSLTLNLKYKTAFDYGYSISKVTSKITKGLFSEEIELVIDNVNQTATGQYENLGIGEYNIEVKVYNGETQVAEGIGSANIERDKIATAEIAIEYFTGALTLNFYLDDGRARIFGLKSCGSTSPGYCSSGDVENSLAPTSLFSFRSDRSDFAEIGAVTIDNSDIDADALAISPTYGLLAFELKKLDFATVSSTLISVNYKTAIASIIGSELNGLDIRGAVFDRAETLWVLDAAGNQLISIDPSTGEIVGSPKSLMLNGNEYDLSDASDIAVTSDDVFIVTDITEFFTLDISTGIMELVNTDAGEASSGAAFSNFSPQDTIFTYEVNNSDDIFRYNSYTSPAKTSVHEDIVNQFNSGRGDLASIISFVEIQP